MLSKGLLVVLSGPSGVGKTTLCGRLVQDQIAQPIVTCTTREPRQGEQEGVHYYFLSREEFSRRVEAGDFIEYAVVYGDFKGVLRSEVEKGLASGKTLLLNVDVQGAATVRKLFPSLLDIFVDVSDSQQLNQRLKARNEDSQSTIENRLQQVEAERAQQQAFREVVYNDELENCYQRLKNLIENYRKEQHVG